MFQFSLFTSYIPYVTIAVMYVLYLGVYSYSRLHADKDPVHIDEAVEKTISWEPVHSGHNVLVQNELFFSDDSPAGAAVENEAVPVISAYVVRCEPPVDRHVPQCLCFKLYSRPPPQVS